MPKRYRTPKAPELVKRRLSITVSPRVAQFVAGEVEAGRAKNASQLIDHALAALVTASDDDSHPMIDVTE